MCKAHVGEGKRKGIPTWYKVILPKALKGTGEKLSKVVVRDVGIFQ